MPKIHQPRYRISLSASNIRWLMAQILTAETFDQPDCVEILAKLAPINRKLAEGTAKAAYVNTGRHTLADSLGFTQEELEGAGATALPEESFATKEAWWEHCYQRAQAGEELSANEVRAAQEHAYLMGLMSPEEEAEFEAREGHTDELA